MTSLESHLTLGHRKSSDFGGEDFRLSGTHHGCVHRNAGRKQKKIKTTEHASIMHCNAERKMRIHNITS